MHVFFFLLLTYMSLCFSVLFIILRLKFTFNNLAVLVKAALDGGDGAAAAHPQLLAHHTDEALVVRH